MRRVLSSVLLSCCLLGGLTGADAVPSDGELLAAARTASAAYQNHLGELASQLSDASSERRIEAMRTLGRLQDPQAVMPILTFLDPPNRLADEQIAAAMALGSSGQSLAIPALRRLSVNSNADVRLAAYNALGSLTSATGGDHTQRAKDESDQPHLAALTNLGTLKQADAAPLLIAGLQHHPRSIVRRMCAIGLGKLGDVTNGPILQAALSDSDPGVRTCAANSIAALNYRPAIPFLLFALDSNIASDDLARVVTRMTGKDFGFDSRQDELKRKAAIEQGFAWWTANSKDGG